MAPGRAPAARRDEDGGMSRGQDPTRTIHSFIPPEHPLYAGEGVVTWTHDPAAGQAKLEDLSKSLKEHAEEARQKLIEQQKKTGN